jgi:hypothetical protein
MQELYWTALVRFGRAPASLRNSYVYSKNGSGLVIAPGSSKHLWIKVRGI